MALSDPVSPLITPAAVDEPAQDGHAHRICPLTTRQVLAVGVLLIAAPVLAFPELAPAAIRTPLVAAVAIVSLALACALLARSGVPATVVSLFAFLVVVAWLRAPNAQQEAILATGLARDALEYQVSVNLRGEALQHFAGIALGLLAMGVVATFANTRERLLLVGAAFAVASIGIVVVGFAGTSREFLAREHAKFFVPGFADALPQVQLGLPVKAHGGWINPNALGATALMVLPINLALALIPLQPSRWVTAARLLGWLASAIAAVVVLLTQSRSVWVAAVIVLVVWTLWRGHRRWARLAAMVIAASVAVVFGLWLGGQSLRLGTVMVTAGESAASRVRLWTFALDKLAESPIFGLGLNQLHVMDGDTPIPGTPLIVAHAHNTALQVALDLGVVGLVCYLALIVWLLARAVQAARGPLRVPAALAVGAGLTLIGVHAFGIGDTVALGARVGVFQWLASGIVLAAWQLQPPGTGNREPGTGNQAPSTTHQAPRTGTPGTSKHPRD